MSYTSSPNFTTGAMPVVAVTNQGKRVAVSAVTVTSITTVLTPSSGKKFRLLGGYISMSASASILFEDNAAGAGNFIFLTPLLGANVPFYFSLGNGYLSAAADNVLKATSSAAGAATGTLFYSEE
jgi:hypothetical protein